MMYPPVRHEALAARLPLVLESGVLVPLLLGLWIEVWSKFISQRRVSPVCSLSLEVYMMQNLRNAKTFVTRPVAASALMIVVT